jgi:hypothetical protein
MYPSPGAVGPASHLRRRYADAPAAALLTGLGAGEWSPRRSRPYAHFPFEGLKVILPMWHNIRASEIRNYSPTLADRFAVSSDKGLDHVTEQLLQAIRRRRTIAEPGVSSPTQHPAPVSNRLDYYASELHRNRVAQIVSGRTPVTLLDGAKLVMHMVPNGAIGDRSFHSFDAIASSPNSFPPMRDTHPRDSRITYDGLVTGSNAEGLSRPQRAYVSVFRSGTVEALRRQSHVAAIMITSSSLTSRRLSSNTRACTPTPSRVLVLQLR